MPRPKWIEWLSNLGSRKKKSKRDVESLRAEFKRRYYHFKLLLTANNKTLEIMSEMEDVLASGPPLGMNFVRSRCTRVATNVYQIVKHLDEISPGRYEPLLPRFKKIQDEINVYLAHPERRDNDEIVISLSDITHDDEKIVGGKMANVGELSNRLGLPIPGGFVLTHTAYWRFIEHNHLQGDIEEMIQGASAEIASVDILQGLAERIQKHIMGCEVPPELADQLYHHYGRLEQSFHKNVSVVMRSSALREDRPGVTFAGQYDSIFNVRRENLVEAYKKVVASKYSEEAIIYRRSRGVRDDDVAMCVGCMPIVDSRAGGVAYSRNPLDTTDTSIRIYSVLGLPKPVADGAFVSDLFVVSRTTPLKIVERNIEDKRRQFTCLKDGTCELRPVEKDGDLPSLSDEQILTLADHVLKIENHYRRPQDVEWALTHDGRLVFLQSRTLEQKEAPKEEVERPDFDRSLLIRQSETAVCEGGVTASPGAAAGEVFRVQTEKDAGSFPEGAVLVAAQSLPYWAVVLPRASAVITEQGNAAGHLATVARELHIPAVFAMEKAMQKLEDRQTITVDADSRVVYKGRVEALLKRSMPKENTRLASPVYEALRGAAEKIVPLRLIDPDSPRFKVRYCKTLHDITRYCHEKSVREMFRFGTDHRFPEKSSRQLMLDVPMQFWIIDLEDGFSPDIEEGRYIRLEDIRSVPMHALWKGMMAIPWKGPPPVSPKGFLGVLMESASNPSLNPALPSAYTARNYFMISKDFCSLQSRFGYHFATAEALVGERAGDNYISFQFKGGAARLERRVRRTRMVEEVLEKQQFRTRQNQDNVSARIEGYEKTVMLKKLEVLGYLMFHTRQLDMVMDNENAIRQYKQKIFDDIDTLSND